MTMMAPTMTMQKVLSLTLCLCFVDATSAWAPRSNAKISFVGSMYSYRRPFSNRGSPRGSVIRYSSAASEAPSASGPSLVEVTLTKPMGIVFEENDPKLGGIFVEELQPVHLRKFGVRRKVTRREHSVYSAP